jgi:hypothetical protein
LSFFDMQTGHFTPLLMLLAAQIFTAGASLLSAPAAVFVAAAGAVEALAADVLADAVAVALRALWAGVKLYLTLLSTGMDRRRFTVPLRGSTSSIMWSSTPLTTVGSSKVNS